MGRWWVQGEFFMGSDLSWVGSGGVVWWEANQRAIV